MFIEELVDRKKWLMQIIESLEDEYFEIAGRTDLGYLNRLRQLRSEIEFTQGELKDISLMIGFQRPADSNE